MQSLGTQINFPSSIMQSNNLVGAKIMESNRMNDPIDIPADEDDLRRRIAKGKQKAHDAGSSSSRPRIRRRPHQGVFHSRTG